MALPSKQKSSLDKKIDLGWSAFNFFLLISFPFALILTIIFWLAGIKTIFWSERGSIRHSWVKGYIAVFLFLSVVP